MFSFIGSGGQVRGPQGGSITINATGIPEAL